MKTECLESCWNRNIDSACSYIAMYSLTEINTHLRIYEAVDFNYLVATCKYPIAFYITKFGHEAICMCIWIQWISY